MEGNIGIVGAGRLGSSLAKHFPKKSKIYICDKNQDIADACAGRYDRISAKTDDIIRELDYIFICIPPDEVRDFFIKYKGSIRESSLVVNMATSIDTRMLADIYGSFHVIPLKPVAESYALLIGLKGVFITDRSADAYMDILSDMFKDMGEIKLGDEMKVQQVNEIATAYALSFYCKLEERLSRLQLIEEVKDAAVKSVAAGTLLGCPPDKDNYYIRKIIKKYCIKESWMGMEEQDG